MNGKVIIIESIIQVQMTQAQARCLVQFLKTADLRDAMSFEAETVCELLRVLDAESKKAI